MRRLALVLLVVPLACGRKEPRSSALARFPELERVDPKVERAFRQLLADSTQDFPSPRALARRARVTGSAAGWALLKILAEEFSEEVYVTAMAAPEKDTSFEATAWCMGREADGDLKRVLRRGLADRELDPRLRRKFVIALRRRGERDAFERLVDIAVDRREAPDLRRSVLLRLHRLAPSPPRRLRVALELPFRDLDLFAAATLARMGDPEAPSLVLEGLMRFGDDFFTRHFVEAGNAITGEDLGYTEAVEFRPGEDPAAVRRERLRPHREALARWLADHPPQTDLERARRAYLASDRRARELRPESFADLLAAGEDFDLASAILLVSAPEQRAAMLEKLDRLARLVRRELDGASAVGERVAVLNRRLLHPRPVGTLDGTESGTNSLLSYVLRRDAGNCLGYSSLHLAIAERCDLPLHGVASPHHVFVRYDDGKVRRNLETTAGGAARPDDAYLDDAIRRAPRVLKERLYLANLTRRQVLASVLNNLAARWIYYARFDRARDAAGQALALDPRHLLARRNRALAAFHSDLGADEAVIADLERALELHPGDAESFLAAGSILVELGRTERARELFAAAEKLEASPEVRAGAIRCAARLRRTAVTPGILLKRLKGEAEPRAVRSANLEALLRLDPERAPEAVAAFRDGVAAREQAAAVLLALDPPRAAAALDLLNEARAELSARRRRSPSPSGASSPAPGATSSCCGPGRWHPWTARRRRAGRSPGWRTAGAARA